MINYEILEDEELARLSKDGDNYAIDILLIRYKPMVKQISSSLYMAGSEQGDVIQEGMIGLFKAIRDYQDNKASFKTFARLCIRSQIIDAIKSSRRNKHMPLNNSLSLDAPAMADNMPDNYGNPEEAVMESEEHKALRDNINKALSSYEIKILNLFLLKKSYQEIADEIGKDAKSIDNALQRIKKKIKELIK